MRNAENETLDDILFENRNKEYGAYALRKNYSGYLYRATVMGIGIFVLIFGGAWTYHKYNKKEALIQDRTTCYCPVDISPQVDKKDTETSPPPPAKKEEPKQVDARAPVSEVDERVEEEQPMPSIEELGSSAISNETKGTGEVRDFTTAHVESAAAEPVEPEVPEENEIFLNAEQQPTFPGGQSEMYRFINSNIKYPGAAQRQNVSGRVFVKFVIEKDGSIGKVEVLKGIGFGCDEEAVRVIRSMPRWNPGKQNGNNVRVYYNMPIFYQLE